MVTPPLPPTPMPHNPFSKVSLNIQPKTLTFPSSLGQTCLPCRAIPHSQQNTLPSTAPSYMEMRTVDPFFSLLTSSVLYTESGWKKTNQLCHAGLQARYKQGLVLRRSYLESHVLRATTVIGGLPRQYMLKSLHCYSLHTVQHLPKSFQTF